MKPNHSTNPRQTKILAQPVRPTDGPFMVADLARRWKCAEQAVHNLIEEGRIVAINIGTGTRKFWRVPTESVRAFEAAASNMNVVAIPAQRGGPRR